MPDHEVLGKVRIVEMLENLIVEEQASVLLGHADGDYSVSTSGGRLPRPKHSVASSLEGAIEECTAHPRKKICLRPDCSSKGTPKSLWAFGPDKDAHDGRAAVCRECEARRINALGKKKKRRSTNVSNGNAVTAPVLGGPAPDAPGQSTD